jgi:Flp pilus assembly pilin Flp
MITELGTKPETPLTSRTIPNGEETIMDLIIRFSWDESGAPAVEYALLLAFIAVAIAASVKSLGTVVSGLFDNAVAKYPTTSG